MIQAVVLSYNHPNLTRRSVTAALQAFPNNTTLVHNGSHRSNINLLMHEFSQIMHAEIPKNIGYSGGANFGISTADADWILLLTNDCDLKQFSVDVSLLHPETVYIPSIYFRDMKRVDSFGGSVNLKTGKLLHCKTQNQFQSLFLNPEAMEFPYVPGSSFLISKKLFLQSGGFDETLFTYWEDVDWSLRLYSTGHKLRLHPGIIIEHGGGKTCRKDPMYTNFYFQRNKRIVCRRWIKHFSKNTMDLFVLESKLMRESISSFLKKSMTPNKNSSRNGSNQRKYYDVVRNIIPPSLE
jgi:GT2 family glycosyltransferase